MIQYYYKKLSLQEQILYRKMHDAFKRQNDFILCGENECSEETYNKVLDAILLDNPSVFYVMPHGLRCEQTMFGLLKIKIEYIVDKKKREELDSELTDSIDQIYEKVDLQGCSEEEKAKSLHNFLISEVELINLSDEIYPYEKTVIGSLVSKRSTAESIVFGYKALLDRIGIENIIVRGSVCTDGQERQERIWNVIKLGKEEKHVDIFEDMIQNNNGEFLQRYFARSPEEIGIDHFWKGKRTENKNEEYDEWCGFGAQIEVDSGSWEILEHSALKEMVEKLDKNQENLLCALAKFPLECNDSRRLKAVLCDVLPTDKATINVFVSAYEEHIHEKIKGKEDINLVKNTMRSTLECKYGYNPKLCEWAVQTWILLNDVRKKLS